MDIRFVDTTLRDGAQSLWASGMRTGMIDAVAGWLDEAGYEAVEVPIVAVFIKKQIRDLKEDPWELMRLIAAKMPKTVKGTMGGGHILSFEGVQPRALVELYYRRLVETGALNRIQVTSNTTDQLKRTFPWIIPYFKKLGLKLAINVSYTISPRHTDEYYGQKVREILAYRPDSIYLKDQGGLLTVDRARTLLPVIVKNSGDVPVELHSHCTTGQTEMVYFEAPQMGVRILHTGIPPLANGSAQPSVLSVASNARLMGHTTSVDESLVRRASDCLTAIAKEEGLPIGAPLEYDYAQYINQVPGGVISNLRHQLKEVHLADRLNEVLEESVQVRKDLGYPIMITPHSQFVVTQAAINVATGERYKLIIDEVINFARGNYGEDSGYPWMDQNLRDKALSLPRAKELAARPGGDITLQKLREKFGGPGISDEEFLLRYIMKGSKEIEAMRAAGPAKQYPSTAVPLASLIEKLGTHLKIRYVQVQRRGESILLQNRSSA